MKSINGNLQIYVLSTDSEIRNTNLADLLSELGNYHIISGINGLRDPKLLDRVEKKNSSIWLNRDLTPGEIACAMGHREMIRSAYKDKAKIALFIEDDARLTREIVNSLKESLLLEESPKAIVICYELRNSIFFPKSVLVGARQKYFKSLSIPICAQMYAMNFAAITNIAKGWDKNQIETPADFPPWYADCLTFYFQFPGIEPLRNDFISKIGDDRFDGLNSSYFRRFSRYSFLTWLHRVRSRVSIRAYAMYFHGRALNEVLMRIRGAFGLSEFRAK